MCLCVCVSACWLFYMYDVFMRLCTLLYSMCFVAIAKCVCTFSVVFLVLM